MIHSYRIGTESRLNDTQTVNESVRGLIVKLIRATVSDCIIPRYKRKLDKVS